MLMPAGSGLRQARSSQMSQGFILMPAGSGLRQTRSILISTLRKTDDGSSGSCLAPYEKNAQAGPMISVRTKLPGDSMRLPSLFFDGGKIMKKTLCRIAGIAMTIVVTAVSFAGCTGAKKEEAVIQATRVETRRAVRGTLELTSTYVGTISPYTSVNVVPLVSGKVESINVRVGDRVEVGDVLCQFDDRAAELQVQSAQDAVETARAGKQAARDQIRSAKKQAQVSITSLKTQRSTLRDQKETSEKQLKELRGGLEKIKQGSEAAGKVFETANAVYSRTNELYIRYQAFLAANPDCATTPGLIAATLPGRAITEVSGGGVENGGTMMVFTVPDYEHEEESGVEYGGNSDFSKLNRDEDKDSGSHSGGNSVIPQPPVSSAEKQRTAVSLLEALGQIPTTVEYVTPAGISTLRDQMEQARAQKAAADNAYTQAGTAITQLEDGIKQLNSQIKALDKNIRAAEDAANSTGGTQVYDAQIRAAQTGVESAEYQKDLYTVTAPIGGIIESVNITEQQLSAQGQPAFTISDKEFMTVTFYVPEDVRDHLKPGDNVDLDSIKGNLKGNISLIGTSSDPQKGLFKIEAQITTVTDKSLLSNTSVSLTLISDSVENEILIPFDSVYYDNDQAYVFIAETGADGSRAVRRDITPGLYNNDLIAVMEGLAEGEAVITSWGAGLKDGAAVEIIHAQ